VEARAKKSTEGATLTFLMMKGLLNEKNDMKEDEIKKVKRFLASLEASVQREYLELQIKAQEDQVQKSQKKLSTLKSEQIDLEKKMQTNFSNQQDMEKEISAKQTALEVLKAKRLQ
jgi:chromosome segregation ATPase